MYLQPGFLTDLSSSKGQQAWDKYIIDTVVKAIQGRSPLLAPPPYLANQQTQLNSPSDTIQWPGEPRRFFKYIDAPPSEILEYLDWTGSGGLQYGRAFAHEEYLEWRTVKNAANKIDAVEMTCESIEYWSTLAQYEPKYLVQLVGEFTGIAESKIDLMDLFGTEDPYTSDPESPEGEARYKSHYKRTIHAQGQPCVCNYNNGTAGMIHMGVAPNALAAAITLAVWAAYPLDADGRAMSGEEAKTTNTQNVQSCRSSDPSIAEKIISVVHGGRRVALANPIGIYMVPFPRSLIRLDGAELPEDWIDYSRGSAAKLESGNNQTWQRLVIKPPKGSKKTIEDLTDQNGDYVTTGGQLARLQSVAILSQVATQTEQIVPLKLQFRKPDKCDLQHPDARSLQQHFDQFKAQKLAGTNALMLSAMSRLV